MLDAVRGEQWKDTVSAEALRAVCAPGGMIVCATKVGYIVMTSDGQGLIRKFEAKNRNRNKPGVVLCASSDVVDDIAELNDEARELYRACEKEDILLGCILPWRKSGLDLIPDATARELVMDARGTSCFVINFGRPAQQLVDKLWEERRLGFASSANPSGIGNKGRIEGVGERILTAADYIVEADDYVRSIQPGKDDQSRHEQGVMVSLVDEAGRLVPEQKGQRSITPAPTLIRRGLYYDRIMVLLSTIYTSWDYRHGQYY